MDGAADQPGKTGYLKALPMCCLEPVQAFLRSGFSRQKPQMQGANTRKIERLASIYLSPLGQRSRYGILAKNTAAMETLSRLLEPVYGLLRDFDRVGNGVAKLKHRCNGDFEQVLIEY